jgi:hypothetical protein
MKCGGVERETSDRRRRNPSRIRRLVDDDRPIPAEPIKEEIRLWLLEQAVDRAYEAKKSQLFQDGEVKLDYDAYFSLNHRKPDDPQDRPKLNLSLAAGKNYNYTVTQYLDGFCSHRGKVAGKLQQPQPRGVLMAIFERI